MSVLPSLRVPARSDAMRRAQTNNLDATLIGRKLVRPNGSDQLFVWSAGNRTRRSTWALPSELPVRSVSVRFVPVRYLRFRFRALTASRAGAALVAAAVFVSANVCA